MIFLIMKRQRRQQQEIIPPSDRSKGTQEESNGDENTTPIQRSQEDQQGVYELQEQAIGRELDPSRGPFYGVRSEDRGWNKD